MSGGRKMGLSRGKSSGSCGLWGVDGDALRERNLLEATDTDFLTSLFECQAMFAAEDSNLQFKSVERTAWEEHIMLLGAVYIDAF